MIVHKPRGWSLGHTHLYLRSTMNVWPSLLYAAASDGDVAMVRNLIDRGASVDWYHPDTGMSALAIAVHKGHTGVVDVLAKHGASVTNAHDEIAAEEPIIHACRYGNLEMVRTLINHGATLNFARVSPLVTAAVNNQAPVVELLLNHKANPNCRDRSGYTAFMLSHRSSLPILQLMLEHNADPNAKAPSGQRCLNNYIWADDYDKVKLVLEHRADPNVDPASLCASTYLSLAFQQKRFEISQLLVDYGADKGLLIRDRVSPTFQGIYDSLSTLFIITLLVVVGVQYMFL